MAKKQPFMTVELKFERGDLEYATEVITDTLYDEFDSEVFEMLDFSGKQFRNELLEFEPFLRCVREGIEDKGYEALNDPWDYIDFDPFFSSKEYQSLFRVMEELQELIHDLNREERAPKDCADAIEVLKRAGFKIVKA